MNTHAVMVTRWFSLAVYRIAKPLTFNTKMEL